MAGDPGSIVFFGVCDASQTEQSYQKGLKLWCRVQYDPANTATLLIVDYATSTDSGYSRNFTYKTPTAVYVLAGYTDGNGGITLEPPQL